MVEQLYWDVGVAGCEGASASACGMLGWMGRMQIGATATTLGGGAGRRLCRLWGVGCVVGNEVAVEGGRRLQRSPSTLARGRVGRGRRELRRGVAVWRVWGGGDGPGGASRSTLGRGEGLRHWGGR